MDSPDFQSLTAQIEALAASVERLQAELDQLEQEIHLSDARLSARIRRARSAVGEAGRMVESALALLRPLREAAGTEPPERPADG